MRGILDYQFKDNSLLELALTHCSFSAGANNERLEHLGDAILGCVISEALFAKFPNASPGDLTRLKISLVRNDTLATLAKQHNLSIYLKLGTSELGSGGSEKCSIMANTMEALIGAIYLDAGFECCRDRVLNLYQGILHNICLKQLSKEPKTKLQEYLQEVKQSLPVYSIIQESGPPHSRTFMVQCDVKGLGITTLAEGKSKRAAEQSAASQALLELQPSQS